MLCAVCILLPPTAHTLASARSWQFAFIIDPTNGPVFFFFFRWFNVRIQLVGATVAVLAGSFVVWWGKDHIEATVAGLALLYALQFTDSVKYLVRQHALLEMQMNSVGTLFPCRRTSRFVVYIGRCALSRLAARRHYVRVTPCRAANQGGGR